MKLHYLLLITIHLSLFTLNVSGQNKPCNNFACAFLKAENFLKQAAYQKALDNLDSAEGYLTDTNTKEKEQIKRLRRRLFVAIEKEKEDAKRARDEAKRQTEIANQKTFELEKALIKNEKIIDAIYFYRDSFGLSANQIITDDKKVYLTKNTYLVTRSPKIKFGFINKNGDVLINYNYDTALPFDSDGLAKVESNGKQFFIDTKGNKVGYANNINEIDSTTKIFSNSLETFDDTLIDCLMQTKLNILRIKNSKLKEIPVKIQQLSYLTEINLSCNQLTNLPSEIGQLSNLNYLNLSVNKLSSIPNEIGSLKNLKFLDLDSNRLNTIPQEIGNLAKLTSLNLSSNELITIPQEIGNLSNLKFLDLSSNKLNDIPQEIGNLLNLTSLHLNKNKLRTLPVGVSKLTNLLNIDLSFNNITSIPLKIQKLTNLSSLILLNNPIPKEEQEKIKKLLPNCYIVF